jgi:hypothetical protein
MRRALIAVTRLTAAAGLTAAVALAVGLTGCGSALPGASPSGPAAPVVSAVASAPVPPGTAADAVVGSPQAYTVLTHCGIDWAMIDGRWYEAARPLSDGQGNPPPGWGNPDQPGTITLTSPTRAIFRDAAGHRVEFLLRPGATGPAHTCS